MAWLAECPDLPVLLAHGADDDLVSPTFTRTFAEALEAAGHPVELKIVPRAGHQYIYLSTVIGDPVIAWISALTGGRRREVEPLTESAGMTVIAPGPAGRVAEVDIRLIQPVACVTLRAIGLIWGRR